MSPERRERVLALMARDGALLAGARDGRGFGVFARADRRRRPLARLDAEEVRGLEASGAIAPHQGGFILSAAGRARARREAAAPGESYLAQHAAIVDRSVIDADGAIRTVRGGARSAAIARLAQLRDARGAPWLNQAELNAARALREDWEAAQAGACSGSDWSAPPIGGKAKRAGNAREQAMAIRCDARRRMAEALEALAAPLRRTVERVCLHEDGVEAIERAESWPARSGKLALKLGLAQLALRLSR